MKNKKEPTEQTASDTSQYPSQGIALLSKKHKRRKALLKHPTKNNARHKNEFGKLTDDEQMEVCALWGTFHSSREIQTHVKECYGKTISPGNLAYYKDSPSWRPIVQKYRDDYTAAIGEVPLANKRKRIEALATQYKKADIKGSVRDAVLALSQIHNEVTPKTNTQIGEFHLTQVAQYNNLSDEELDKRRLELIELIGETRRNDGDTRFRTDEKTTSSTGGDEINIS